MIWDDSKVVAWDLETSGDKREYALQPWRWEAAPTPGASWVTSTSMIRHSGEALVTHGSCLYPTAVVLRAFLEEAITNDWVVVGWNITFDIMWLFAMGLGDLAHRVRWLDAMLLWKHLEIEPEYEFMTARHKKRSYALKPGGIQRFIPVAAGYEEDIDFSATDAVSLAKLQRYNDQDSVHTWVIAAIVWDQLNERQRDCAVTESACLSMIAQANYEGMMVDTLACEELSQWLAETADDLLAKLSPHGVTEKIVRSPMQLGKLMFDEWKLPVLKENTSKTTGKTSRSTDKEVLHELAFRDPRCAHLRGYREALGNRAKFAVGIADSVAYNEDGHTRPSAIVFGTYSGRMTYGSKQGKGVNAVPTGFPLHQEKRDPVFRSVIVAPPGYTLMEFDAAGQEYRWMAIAANDPTMLHLCMPGEDPHSFMGARITGGDYVSLMVKVAADDKLAGGARQLGKVGNLSLQYRTSAKKLRSVARVQYSIPLELPEAQRIHRTYQQTYNRVPAYWGEQISLTKQRGWVETLAGRRVQVVGDWGGDWGWSMGSTAINYRIQGTGADQKYLALKAIKSYVLGVGGRFAWELHDGIYFYVPDDKVERAALDIKQLLDNLPYKEAWGFQPPVPLPWDAKAGKSWGALKGIKF